MPARSLAVFGLDYCLLFALFGLSVLVACWWVKVIAGLLLGLVIGQLFVIGHDACHGSLSASRRLNRLVGTLAFLPSLTPFSTWALGHNQIHHVYTNLKSRDYIWAPFSKAEYDRLSPWRRRMERMYRTPLGHGLNYLVEIWWKHLIFPRVPAAAAGTNVYARDVLLVLATAGCIAASAAIVALVTGQNVAFVLLCSGFLPFVEFNAIIGFLIFQHHTSPHIRWYANEAQWKAARSQIDTVQHVIFPGLFNVLFQNIMEHHAHHLDPTISLHQLRPAQRALEKALGSSIRIVHWTPRSFAETSRVCKLYDYDVHRWRDFDGRYTS